STRSIVWGKWWGTYRTVPLLAICPGLVAAAIVQRSGRWELAALVVTLYLAYGAAVTSLGLALSTWMRRLDHAVALNVTALGGFTFGWFFSAMVLFGGNKGFGIAAASPIIGIAFPTAVVRSITFGEWQHIVFWWPIWIIVYAAIAASLAWAT